MTAKEIREKSNTELLQEIETLKDELFNLRFQQAASLSPIGVLAQFRQGGISGTGAEDITDFDTEQRHHSEKPFNFVKEL